MWQWICQFYQRPAWTVWISNQISSYLSSSRQQQAISIQMSSHLTVLTGWVLMLILIRSQTAVSCVVTFLHLIYVCIRFHLLLWSSLMYRSWFINCQLIILMQMRCLEWKLNNLVRFKYLLTSHTSVLLVVNVFSLIPSSDCTWRFILVWSLTVVLHVVNISGPRDKLWGTPRTVVESELEFYFTKSFTFFSTILHSTGDSALHNFAIF